MKIMWEGHFFRPLSLDKVNRETVLEAMNMGHEMILRVSDATPLTFNPAYGPLYPLISDSQPVDVHVRHQWPPNWGDRSGPLVVYQGWESGAVPDDWVDPLNNPLTVGIAVYSSAVKEMFVYSGVAQEKIVVVPLGVNRTIYHPYGQVMKIEQVRKRVLLWVGGLIPRKGLDILLKAYRLAVHPDDDVTLVIKVVGQGTVYQNQEVPKLLQAAMADPRSPHIVVMDQKLSESEMASLYRRATALVSPYRGEGFNLPVLEAMACGAMVIASDTEPTNEFVPENIGWRIPGKRRYFSVDYSHKQAWEFEADPEALAHILKTVLGTSASEQEHRRSLAQVHVQAHYTWRHTWRAWENILRAVPSPVQTASKANNKIIWRGPIRNASGYSSEARTFLKHLPQYGVWPRIIDESYSLPSVSSPQEEELWKYMERLPVPDSSVMVHGLPGHAAYHRRRGTDVARVFFETDRVPTDWVPRLKELDGVIVASPFNRRTFADSGVDPSKIHIVPSPVDTNRFVPPSKKISHDAFRFLSIFDWSYRKGWDLLIEAWYKAFTRKDPVKLILKLTNLVTHGPERELALFIRKKNFVVDEGAPIQIITENLSEDAVAALYQSANAFVLPTRGEGWGRPILEAMACDLPVIVTNWSAPADYLNVNNSYPIRIKGLEKISDSYPLPFYRGHYWAEPDVDHMIHQLRACYQNGSSTLSGIRETALKFSPDNATRELVRVLKTFGVVPEVPD